MSGPSGSDRFLMWVDEVGGFLVCLGDSVRLGQAVPDSPIEIPLLADLSRHHATIRRDAEGYLLDPCREARINGGRLERATWLGDGDQIALGPALVLRFRRPHPLSATARLELVSPHQTSPSTSAILLMAETCVLGPAETSHVVCRRWEHEVVLCRQGRQLICRSDGRFKIDGKPYQHRGPLPLSANVEGEQFALSLEELANTPPHSRNRP